MHNYLVLEFTTTQEGIDPYFCAENSDGAAGAGF